VADWTLEDLRLHLQAAVELELLVIPPYLCALYSIQPGANAEAELIIRSVVVEEMLHMILAANVLNAVGGRPALVNGGWIPRYPAAIPYHKPDSFRVGLLPLCDRALDTFLAIENPSYPVAQAPIAAGVGVAVPRATELAREHDYATVGAFYAAIEDGLQTLDAALGRERLFSGHVGRQIGPSHYYGAGGDVTIVQDLAGALEAIGEIVEQGEGELRARAAAQKYDDERDLAHYYRINELRHRRRYRSSDTPDAPTGDPIELDLDAVYPMKPDLRVADLEPGPLREAAVACNAVYGRLLAQLQTALDGRPDELLRAVPTMFELKYAACDLLRVPLGDGSGLNAGPTFEWP
jgi:hypothetical protein